MTGYLYSKDLIVDFSNKRKKAFDALYDRYHSDLYILCYKILRDKEEARDIAVVTLNKLFQKSADFDNRDQMAAFLFTAARNSCLNHLRYLKKMTDGRNMLITSLKEMGEGYSQQQEREAMMNDRLDAAYLGTVKRKLECLPERQRKAIELLFYDEKRYSQVAVEMNITVDAVKKLRSKALTNLGKLISSQRLVETALLLIAIFSTVVI